MKKKRLFNFFEKIMVFINPEHQYLKK